MSAKQIIDTVAADVHKAALIVQSVAQGSVVQGAVKAFPEIEGIVGTILKDAGLTAAVTGAVPYVEAALALAQALGAKPNEDLDNVGPGRAEMRDGGIGPS